MRKLGLFCLVIIFLIVIAIRYSFFKPSFNYLSGFLSKSELVSANILIIEGWLPDYALETAYNESRKNMYEHVVTTGIKETSNYYKLYNNGYLIFHTHNILSGMEEAGSHSIEVDAYSELSGEDRAHFNLLINDSLASDFYAEKSKASYICRWEGALSDIDSITVQFTNEKYGGYYERNLYVKEIIIDHSTRIPYLNNSEYDIGKLDRKRRIVNNYSSSAEFARNRLLSMGMDSSLIIALPGEKVRFNRTLSSALAFRDWAKRTDPEINGINIISMGIHARRTWMTYNKILNKKYKIGIISLPYKIKNKPVANKDINTLREALMITYYWFILIPY